MAADGTARSSRLSSRSRGAFRGRAAGTFTLRNGSCEARGLMVYLKVRREGYRGRPLLSKRARARRWVRLRPCGSRRGRAGRTRSTAGGRREGHRDERCTCRVHAQDRVAVRPWNGLRPNLRVQGPHYSRRSGSLQGKRMFFDESDTAGAEILMRCEKSGKLHVPRDRTAVVVRWALLNLTPSLASRVPWNPKRKSPRTPVKAPHILARPQAEDRPPLPPSATSSALNPNGKSGSLMRTIWPAYVTSSVSPLMAVQIARPVNVKSTGFKTW